LFLPENFELEHSENGFSADSVVTAGRFGRKEKAKVKTTLMSKDILHNFPWLDGKSEDLCPKANVGKSYYTYFP
jgi:transposase